MVLTAKYVASEKTLPHRGIMMLFGYHLFRGRNVDTIGVSDLGNLAKGSIDHLGD
jgi:hypothetical protein